MASYCRDMFPKEALRGIQMSSNYWDMFPRKTLRDMQMSSNCWDMFPKKAVKGMQMSSNCWDMFPKKAPRGWSSKNKNLSSELTELATNQTEDISLINCDSDTCLNQVFAISHDEYSEKYAKNYPNSTLSTSHTNTNVSNKIQVQKFEELYTSASLEMSLTLNDQRSIKQNFCQSRQNQKAFRFIIDSAATKHIVCDASLFATFKPCKKVVRWGGAKSIIINGMGDLHQYY
ncbi:hypothetical protein K3495_g15918 [Podosphaera aphanis]|nr:hypothetical protein K3495_g15918 [Podosphaera aphanis]